MSLMKTLGRVAAGVILAKGIGAAMQQHQQGRPGQVTRNRSQGGLLGELFGNNSRPGAGGGLNDMLGQVLGGGRPGTGTRYGGPQSSGASGGLGGLLDGLTTRARSGSSGGGGLGDLLGQLGGGSKTRSAGSGGGLGDILGGLLGGAAAGGMAGNLARKDSQPTNDASFGELFNDAVVKQGEPEVAPTPEQNAVAGLMLRAMIQAAKSDGTIDEAEKQRLLGKLGDDLDDEERQFIRDQMAAPVDPEALARDVPQGLESQVYLMSLLAIDLDHEDEVRYLGRLAQALKLDRPAVQEIHDQVGIAAPQA
ncbi:tellurite resistance TerB family protein [Paracoccus benzoatiresistens]|uniref:Tellurite resistance TerB family protein n=1 Tax=Paracoccus benzoatiresistens TaxID=2997341 RepID=A0ABT4J4S3_9RHOB|nr:tellurite resistance TerB family protein [Paracoccus sp. EF6]MCZ0961421.1 tellurite resistance TerB family protein [Paracoccus sp. EF6]